MFFFTTVLGPKIFWNELFSQSIPWAFIQWQKPQARAPVVSQVTLQEGRGGLEG